MSLAGAHRALGSTAGLVLALGGLAAPGDALPSAPASLQDLVDATPAGGELAPPPGAYHGSVVLRRPIQIDGRGRVTIDAGGEGTVLRIQTDGALVRGLRLVHSGANHDHLDAGIQVRGDRNRIEDNRIEDCLFGIDLKQADHNRIRHNRIRSKPLPLGIRGDGIRLWYSKANRIVGNDVTRVRDVVVWYSGENWIAHNRIRDSRYGLHLMYSHQNSLVENRFERNSVGIFLMYSNDVTARGNEIIASSGPTGMGLGVKEASDITLEDNSIVYSARGLYLDVSPYDPDSTNTIRGNRFAFNGVGITFHSNRVGNRLIDNRFYGNFRQVTVDDGSTANRNEWRGNAWDDYRGFDLDGDGIGDAPYELYSFADRIWIERPEAAFFRGSPVLELIDFLDRLAPFSNPQRVLRDPRPRMAGATHSREAAR
ncbi:MAG: nitrous oxide reductase family maturation protein NosD [Myxococcota bacterium]